MRQFLAFDLLGIPLHAEDRGPDDTLVIAGKGHEDYQEVRGIKTHFDDREVAREALDGRGGAR